MRMVLLVADSLRADALGARTPTLDGLAAQGVRFASAMTCAPWTVPSLAAMVTGRYAHRLGLYRWEQPLPQFPNLFLSMADAGYHVASFVFDPGHLFCAVPEAGVLGSSQDLDAVISWIEANRAQDLFLLVHYWGTHLPYLDTPMTVPQWKAVTDELLAGLAKDPVVVRQTLQGLYRRSIERLDGHFLPRLLAATARHSRTEDGWLVAVTGDHGESWGEHREVRDVFDLHGNDLREDVLRIPLVLGGPAVHARGEIRGLARSVDLAPTLLDLAGATPLADADGGSLREAMARGVTSVEGGCAAASADFVDATELPSSPEGLWTALCWKVGRLKYHWDLRTGERTWFDLEADPGEQSPCRPGTGEPAEGWVKLERERARCVCAPAPDPGEQRLRGLGYLE